jgi:hypothetical protein
MFEGYGMRDIQLQSGKTYSLPIKLQKKELFCTCCADEVLKSLENLRGVKADVFPVILLCGAFRCEKCNLRTGLLYEVREV